MTVCQLIADTLDYPPFFCVQIDRLNAMELNGAAAMKREAERRERRSRTRQAKTGTNAPGGGVSGGLETKKPFASSSRWERARWSVAMCLPCFLLFFLRLLSKEGALKGVPFLETWFALSPDTSNIHLALTSTIYAGSALCFSVAVALNELKGSSRVPAYFYVFVCAFSWGSCIDLLEDLVLARMCCMAIFGIGAGQLWFLWDRHVAKKKLHFLRLERKRAELVAAASSGGGVGNATTTSSLSVALAVSPDGVPSDVHAGIASSQSDCGGGNSSGVDGPSVVHHADGATSSTEILTTSTTPILQQPLSSHEVGEWLWSKMGLAALWSLGEVLGCLMFVNSSYQLIGSSLLGYPLLVVFPIVCVRGAMGFSWVLTILVGNSHAYSARILRALHLVFTILVLILMLGGLFLLLRHYVPLVWSLQKLVGPYCLVIENISYSSRKYQSRNPYQGIVDRHKESIALYLKKH